MRASPPGTGRQEAAPGRDGDLADTPSLTRPPRRHGRRDLLTVGLAGLVPALVVVACLVTQNHRYWGLPASTVVVTSATPDGTMDDGRTTCVAFRFAVRAPADGRTGSLRDCRALYKLGERIRVEWSPTDPAVVNPHVMQPLDITLAAGVLALCPLGIYGLRSLGRRRNALRD